MSTLIAITYPDLTVAEDALKELQTLQSEYLLQLRDAVIVERTTDGKIKLHQTVNRDCGRCIEGSLLGQPDWLAISQSVAGRRSGIGIRGIGRQIE
jgi:uncharacterized membrane protein